MGLVRVAVPASMAMLAAACASLTGLSDLQLGSPDGSANGEDSAPEGAPPGYDATSEAVSDGPEDRPVWDSAGCKAGASCVPAVPAGWTFADFNQDTQAPCPSGYGAPVSTMEGIHAAPATCACMCAIAQPPTCSIGTVTLIEASDPTCTNAPNENLVGGTCTQENFQVPSGSYGQAPPPGPSGGSCNATPSTSVAPPTFDALGVYCPVSGASLGACPGGACYPAANGLACIFQSGDVGCPVSYPNKHVVGASVDDQRGCSACSCTTSAACTGGSLRFFATTNCSGGVYTDVPIDGACHLVGVGTWNSYLYSATVSNAVCTSSQAMPTGQATLQGTTTLCCL